MAESHVDGVYSIHCNMFNRLSEYFISLRLASGMATHFRFEFNKLLLDTFGPQNFKAIRLIAHGDDGDMIVASLPFHIVDDTIVASMKDATLNPVFSDSEKCVIPELDLSLFENMGLLLKFHEPAKREVWMKLEIVGHSGGLCPLRTGCVGHSTPI